MKDSQVNDFTIDSSKSPNLPKVTKALGNLYKQTDQSANLAQMIKEAKQRRLWLWITISLIAAAGLALAGFLVFSRQTAKFGEDAVVLNLTGPTSSPSGQTVEYHLTYNNQQTVALKNVEINLRYADGFTFSQAEPLADNAAGTLFSLPDIKGGGQGELVIKGQLVGQVGDKKDINAVISYQPSNVNAQYAKTLTFTTEVTASAINLTVDGPSQLVVDQTANFKVSYHNSSTDKLVGLMVRLVTPGGFVLDVPQLSPVANSANTWSLPDLDVGQSADLNLTGHFTNIAVPGNQDFYLGIGLTDSNGNFAVQEEKKLTINLNKTDLSLNLTINDASAKSAADLGQNLSYQLSLFNQSDKSLTDLTVTAKLDANYLDWLSLQDDYGGSVDSGRGTIVWTATQMPLLQEIKPGGRVLLKWNIKIKGSLPSGISASPSFNSQVSAQAKEMSGSNLQVVSAESSQITTKLNSALKVTAAGRYYTDQSIKVGSGPLPPRVGQTTTYVIFWTIKNSFNEVDNVDITTTLPLGVSWTGQINKNLGSNLTYNSNTRQVNWHLDQLPAQAGSVGTVPQASFEVAITPQASDIDKILVLTKTTTATGQDNFSGGLIVATANFVTTDLTTDAMAQGKGVVGN